MTTSIYVCIPPKTKLWVAPQIFISYISPAKKSTNPSTTTILR